MEKKIKHVAIIMDGNGRWAKQRFRPRIWGHIRGSSIVGSIVEAASDLELQALTLYAFSTENWSRPEDEIRSLFKLLHKFLKKESVNIIKNNIQFKVVGNIEPLDSNLKALITDIENKSAKASGLKLSFAFNYGGRQEILDAVNKHIQLKPGIAITEIDMNKLLYRPEVGEVDLMIRTAGDQRISNFLLWQMAYAELYFTTVKWPDFTNIMFKKIIEEVEKRDRRFGGLDNSGNLQASQEVAKINLNKLKDTH
jgi:undecaprenyl diphosphate synthase